MHGRWLARLPFSVAAFPSDAEARRAHDFCRRAIKGLEPTQVFALGVPFAGLR